MVVSLPLNRKFHLCVPCVGYKSQCVGSSDGWLVLATEAASPIVRPDVLLVNPLTRQQVALPQLPPVDPVWGLVPWSVRESKVVFAPNPREETTSPRWRVVRGQRTVACLHAGWSIGDISCHQAELVDVVCHGGKFYGLSRRGDVY